MKRRFLVLTTVEGDVMLVNPDDISRFYECDEKTYEKALKAKMPKDITPTIVFFRSNPVNAFVFEDSVEEINEQMIKGVDND